MVQRAPSDRVERIAYLVYDADGGWLGEATYFVKKWLGLGKCDLCVITHKGLRPRDTWREASERLDVEVHALHRNELTDTLRAFIAGAYPCVVGSTDGTLGWILKPAEIAPYIGAPERLAETIATYFEPHA